MKLEFLICDDSDNCREVSSNLISSNDGKFIFESVNSEIELKARITDYKELVQTGSNQSETNLTINSGLLSEYWAYAFSSIVFFLFLGQSDRGNLGISKARSLIINHNRRSII